MIFRRSENNFYLIPTAKDQGENGGISGLRPLYIDLTNGRVTLGNGAVVNGGLGLGVVSGLGGTLLLWGIMTPVSNRTEMVCWMFMPTASR